MRLQEFHLEIRHRKGRKSANVDSLTRDPAQIEPYGEDQMEKLCENMQHSFETRRQAMVLITRARTRKSTPKEPTKPPSPTIVLPAVDSAPTVPVIPSSAPIIAKPSSKLREFLLKESKRVVDDIKTSGVVRPPYLDEEEVPMDRQLIEDGDYYEVDTSSSSDYHISREARTIEGDGKVAERKVEIAWKS